MGKRVRHVLFTLTSVILVAVIQTTQGQDPTEKPKVPVPPMIVVNPPKTLAFRVEESLEMPCVATGEPQPEYHWEFNSERFDPSGNDDRIAIQPGIGTLIFARPLERDEGLYQCFATNKYGVATSVKVVLRKGELQPFPEKPPTTMRPNLGMALTLRCNPPTSYPHPNIMWTIVASGALSEPVDYSARVSMDPEGNLNFANIERGDEVGGRQYACVVSNSVMRRDQRGSYYKIIINQGEEDRYPPRLTWSPPSNQIAKRGETWRVKCIFAGNPTPRVTWRREGGELPSRKRIESYGQELIIENVQYEDAGKYECEGENEESQTPHRKSFRLVVESAPFWTHMPQSINAAEGDEARFRCEASGRPSPEIAWFIDGVTITKVKEDPRRTIEGNEIIFKNLTIQDPMVFQCNASNKNGYIFANAYLNVQSEPPVIIEPPAAATKVAEGQTINVTCKVFGSPKPLVVWSKGNEQLTGGNFKVLEDGNLQIQTVSLVNAGEYTCTATNKWDTTSAKGTLIVRRKTQIQTKPLDVMVYEHTEVKFTCTATTDPEEISNLKIVWKKNGQEIDFALAARMFQNNLDNSLTISGTMSLDTAAYSCMATNGLDEDESTAQLVVQGVPDAPERINVNCSDKATPPKAVIEWMPARENYAPILNFIIQYNTTFAPDQWVTIASNVSQNDRSITVELSPYANYTFRVLARNKIGMSEPSIVFGRVCSTEPAAPTKNPDNVIGEGDEPYNLVIYWTPVAPIDRNGAQFEYIVRWQREGGPEMADTVTGAENYHLVVSETEPTYTAYNISVQSKNVVNHAPDPVPIVGYSGEDAPLINVPEVRVVPDSLTSTEVTLEWDPIKNDPGSIRGFFRGYRVEYWVQGQEEDTRREIDHIINQPRHYPRPRPKRQAVLTTTPIPMVMVHLYNLRPYSTVEIQVRILNKYYAGKPSPTVQVKTPEGEPGPPRMFEVSNKGPTHFELQWEAPVQTNGVLIGYNMSYQILTGLTGGRLQYREAHIEPTVTAARLTGLKPNTDYRVFLSAATAAGVGEPMFLDAFTSPAGAPNPATFDFTGDIGETYVDIEWVPSRKGNPGSVFYVQYRVRGQYHWMHSRDEALLWTMRIENLYPGTTYQMRVVAKNGVGLESAAEWQEVTTGGLMPGGVNLGTAMWFYGIFIALILIALAMVGFMFFKRFRDDWWEKTEEKLQDHVRHLQAQEAAKQIGIENQYATGSQQDLGPGVSYGGGTDSEPESDDEGGFRASQEMAPPLQEKKSQTFKNVTYGMDEPPEVAGKAAPTTTAAAAPLPGQHPGYTAPAPQPHLAEGGQPPAQEQPPPEDYAQQDYYGQYAQDGYPTGYYAEDGQYYEYDPNSYPPEQYYDDGQYQYPPGEYDAQYADYYQQQQPQQQDPQGHVYFDKGPTGGSSYA